ncbi:MAG: hypothetical protein Q8872_01205 [Candidatus Phytoplasma australasiaticum]|nr:hypothetical protein [Candidatus Phytoplasma australasiaticum]
MKIKKIKTQTNTVSTNHIEDNELNKTIAPGANELVEPQETNNIIKPKKDWFSRMRDSFIIFFILLAIFTQFCEQRIPFVNYEPKTFQELTSHKAKNDKPKEVKNAQTNPPQEKKAHDENNKKNK